MGLCVGAGGCSFPTAHISLFSPWFWKRVREKQFQAVINVVLHKTGVSFIYSKVAMVIDSETAMLSQYIDSPSYCLCIYCQISIFYYAKLELSKQAMTIIFYRPESKKPQMFILCLD